MSRRIPSLVVVVTAIIAIAIVARSTPSGGTPTFTEVRSGWMPSTTEEIGLSDTWFCPGVPATGEEGVGGEVVISNRSDEPVTARIEWLGPSGDADADPVIDVLPIEARTILSLSAQDRLRGSFVSAVVEVDGAGVSVEQRAIHPAGEAVSPCATATATEWYFADGFTVGGSLNRIVLTNPFEDVVIVDVGFATEDGSRVPAAYQGIPLAPRSVQVLDLGAPGTGAQGEERLAVRVEATRGQLIAARSQHFLAGNRLGFTMSLGAPALRDQWWFADGEKGPGVSERFSIYNPTAADVEVDVIFLGVRELAEVDPILVPARQVVTFDPGPVATLYEGRHATVFSTRSEPAVVVERAITRTVDGRPHTSVLLGAPPRPDGYVATRWHAVIGPTGAMPGALVLYNVDNTVGSVTVEAIGPDGPMIVPGLEAIELPAAAILTIDLVDPMVFGRELVITSTTRVFVERSLTADTRGGRSASWALPAS